MTYSVEFKKHRNAGTAGRLTVSLKAPAASKQSGVKACVVLVVLQFTTACDPRASGGSARSSQAETLFRQHCSMAGETIKRRVKDVEGIFLFKGRPEKINYGDQFLMDDPYGHDLGGDAYIESFLKASYEASRRYAALTMHEPALDANEPVGYDFVEMVGPKPDDIYRYTAFVDQPGKTNPKFSINYFSVILKKSATPRVVARYGVTYEDISTPKDRSLWIAGSSLKVIDRETGEVIAERIGYMIDGGQGSEKGGRSPWLLAASNACPAFPGRHSIQAGQTARFVEKVLAPARHTEPHD